MTLSLKNHTAFELQTCIGREKEVKCEITGTDAIVRIKQSPEYDHTINFEVYISTGGPSYKILFSKHEHESGTKRIHSSFSNEIVCTFHLSSDDPIIKEARELVSEFETFLMGSAETAP